jgi:hypothetical protein
MDSELRTHQGRRQEPESGLPFRSERRSWNLPRDSISIMLLLRPEVRTINFAPVWQDSRSGRLRSHAQLRRNAIS